GQDGQRAVRAGGDGGIERARRLGQDILVGVEHVGAMHLLQPDRLDAHKSVQPPPVLLHELRTVARVQTQIQAGPLVPADAAGSRGAEIKQPGLSRAADSGDQGREFHSTVSWTDWKSEGGGAMKDWRSPVSGSSNCRTWACSIWRWAPAIMRPPYKVSASRGWRMKLRCTRIWWVRPVSSRQATSVTASSPGA